MRTPEQEFCDLVARLGAELDPVATSPSELILQLWVEVADTYDASELHYLSTTSAEFIREYARQVPIATLKQAIAAGMMFDYASLQFEKGLGTWSEVQDAVIKMVGVWESFAARR